MSRDTTLDRLRISFLLLMLIDHTLHGYAFNWGKFWFVHDSERDVFWDILYMHNNSVIIPMLFFVSGQTVWASVMKHGLPSYVGRRLLQLIVPALFGLVFLAPLMSYGKYVHHGEGGMGLWVFYWDAFWGGKSLQAGPMWVLYILFIHSTIAATVFVGMGARVRTKLANALPLTLRAHPVRIAGFVMIVCALLLGFSDMRWGAPWWIGFGKLFHVQGSRFMVQGLFFWIGAFWGLVPARDRQALYHDFMPRLPTLLATMVAFGVLYIGYALLWFDAGAYSDEVYLFFSRGGSWADVMPFLKLHAGGVWVRTSLHAVFLPLQIVSYVLLLEKFRERGIPWLDQLAPIGLGLFLFHPVFVVWLQIAFDGGILPSLIKIAVIVPLALLGSVACSRALLPLQQSILRLLPR